MIVLSKNKRKYAKNKNYAIPEATVKCVYTLPTTISFSLLPVIGENLKLPLS